MTEFTERMIEFARLQQSRLDAVAHGDMSPT